MDSSALMAIVLGEPLADACGDAIDREDDILLASPTLTETLIVAMGKGVGPEMRELLEGIAPAIVPLSAALAREAADAYRRWGKGFHPAALNYCDCFSYALARDRGCPLLFIGADFARTDAQAAI